MLPLKVDKGTALKLPSELTHEQVMACLSGLLAQVRQQEQGLPCVVVDASATQVFDSSALAVLLACRREALSLGKSFVVQGWPERLASLATLYGVASLFALQSQVASA